MKKITFALYGGGWRAEFYARVARAMPEKYEITAALVRREETAARLRRLYGIPSVFRLEDLLNTRPDFVVLCITKVDIADALCDLMGKNIPVLCETPPAVEKEKLLRVWDSSRRAASCAVQIAEQYPLQPYYAACFAAAPLLGDVSNLTTGMVHGYHAVSLIRRFLNVGFETAAITGRQYTFPVCRTGGRQGMCYTGEPLGAARNRFDLVFASGKAAFFDFSAEQYDSYIRARHFNLQGTKGEINDLCVRYVNDAGDPVRAEMRRLDLGVYGNREWSHFGIEMNGRFLYKSPCLNARLNDDELAVAACLDRMNDKVRFGRDGGYSLADGLQDAYLALLMTEALRTPWHTVVSEKMPWAE